MDRVKVKTAAVLLLLGTCGVLSLLDAEMPRLPEIEAVIKEGKITADQLRYLSLVNPMILLVVSILGGIRLSGHVNLRLPLVDAWAGGAGSIEWRPVLRYGLLAGILAGASIEILGYLMQAVNPQEMHQLSGSTKPSLFVRFHYGGITEEILFRFGLMTFLVWIFLSLRPAAGNAAYWIAIALSSMVFALGHFPLVFLAVTSPSLALLAYVLVANSIGGAFFGWLYWRKGLEASIVAHMTAHGVMVLATAG